MEIIVNSKDKYNNNCDLINLTTNWTPVPCFNWEFNQCKFIPVFN